MADTEQVGTRRGDDGSAMPTGWYLPGIEPADGVAVLDKREEALADEARGEAFYTRLTVASSRKRSLRPRRPARSTT